MLGLFKNKIDKLELIPSTGGVFEISLNDKLLFSKKELNRYPEDKEIFKLLVDELKK